MVATAPAHAPAPRADRIPRLRGQSSRIAVSGLGEVGSAFQQLHRETYGADPILSDPPRGVHGDLDRADVVHVCVPAHAVHLVVTKRPRNPLYVVHSTVPPGTCRSLAEKGLRVVHGPVRGVHPHLAQSLKTFTMPISGKPDAYALKPGHDLREATDLLQDLGVRVVQWFGWENTELAKTLCTTRLGLDVLFMRHVHLLCAKFGADPELVYAQWTQQYNGGFMLLGHEEYVRPVLKPVSGPIGGHCVMPNARMLAPDSVAAQLVAEAGVIDWEPTPSPAVSVPVPSSTS